MGSGSDEGVRPTRNLAWLPAWLAPARIVPAATAATIAATTAEAVAATAAAGRPGFTRTRFVDCETASIELRTVEGFDGAVGARIIRHFDEAEAP